MHSTFPGRWMLAVTAGEAVGFNLGAARTVVSGLDNAHNRYRSRPKDEKSART
ncbi:hypothetical protein ABIE37_000480 [Arthrobacter bambusae]|uniref:Uncharacterized protein n=1 Tax=Arthrobacter bambusae TaxID=1338426 RepID=A0ABV2P1T5_9MICC